MDNVTRKTGPKRLRKTRRELPYGGISLWGNGYHFKREMEKKRDRAERFEGGRLAVAPYA